jgi:hypothetical protein
MHFRVSNRVRLIMSLRAQERSVWSHNARLAKRLAAAQIDMQRSSRASDLLDIVGLNSSLWAARRLNVALPSGVAKPPADGSGEIFLAGGPSVDRTCRSWCRYGTRA